MILLVAATALEIPAFVSKNDENVKVLITGVGVPAALYHLQKEITQKQYSFIIQAGIAGAFNNEFDLGETILVKQDCFADIGADEKGKFSSIFAMDFIDKNEFPYENGWLVNTNPILTTSNLEVVKSITVNTISDNQEKKQQFSKNYNPEIETMEGAALHYVCLQENIPFVQIRSISNYVGDRNKNNWNISLAITNLNNELEQLIQSFIKEENK